jgi:hypothetical protein
MFEMNIRMYEMNVSLVKSYRFITLNNASHLFKRNANIYNI